EISGVRRAEQPLGHLAEALMRGYLDQTFVHGEIHADPHPGNLLVTDDGRLAIFDLGMVAHVPPRQRDRLLKLLFAAVVGRGERAGGAAVAMARRREDFDAGADLREVSQGEPREGAHRSASRQCAGHGVSIPAVTKLLADVRLVLALPRIASGCGLRTPP